MYPSDQSNPRLAFAAVLSAIAHALIGVTVGVVAASAPAPKGADLSGLDVHLDPPGEHLSALPQPVPDPAESDTRPPPPAPPDHAEAAPSPASSSPPPPPPPPPQTDEPRVRLGSTTSKSEAATLTWLGFDEYMEHTAAKESILDQPQLTRSAPGPLGPPGAPGPAGQPGEAANPGRTGGAGETPMEALASAAPANQDHSKALMDAPADADARPRPRQAQIALADKLTQPPEASSPRADAPRPSDAKAAPQVETVKSATPPQSQPPPANAPNQESATAPRPSGASTVAMAAQPFEEVGPGTQTTGPTHIEPSPPRRGSSVNAAGVSPVASPLSPDTARTLADKPPATPSQPLTPSTLPSTAGVPPVGAPVAEKSSASSPAVPRESGAATGPVPQGPLPDPAAGPSKPMPVAASPADRTAEAQGANRGNAGGQNGGGGGSEGDTPGLLSDSESIAAAIKKAEHYQWGKPLASKGLKISTVRPRFTNNAVLRGVPREPVVRILFNSHGDAWRVQLLRSSGNADIDRPLVDACYEWRAEGEELKQLSEKDPPETIAINVRILW